MSNRTGVQPPKGRIDKTIEYVDDQSVPKNKLTKLERMARREAAQSVRLASFGGIGSGFGNHGGGAISHADSAFYSPQLSTDFLEMPQSEREKRELYRFWYACFPPGAPVVLPDGRTTPIENLEVGDQVVNALGKTTDVIRTFVYDVDDTLVNLSVRGVQSLIKSTGNHPFLVYRANQVDYHKTDTIGICKSDINSICSRTKCCSKDLGEPIFIEAKDLLIGDYIVSPWINESKECSLNRAQLRLLGYYASEGSIAYRHVNTPRGVEFSLNIDEAETIATEIAVLVKEAGYGKARIYKIPEKNACKVICDNLSLLDLCRFHCGSLAELKKLSHELFNAAPEQLFEFLGAYWNGDGCFTNNSYTAGSVSQEMAHQIHQMLRRLGIPSYYSTYDPKLYNIKKPISENRFPISYVSFPGHYQNIFGQYAKFVSGTYDASSTIVYTVKTDIGFLHRVESISYERYVGKVHNIEVRSEGMAKSYIAFGLATHNSHPIVGAAIDFHTDVPISKLRLSLPKGQDKKKCKQILAFYEKMCKRLRLFQTLYDATHQYWLQGIAYIFAEDHDLSTEVPEDALFDVSEEEIGTVDYAGRTEKKKNKIRVPKSKEERDKIVRDLVSKKYEGWKRLQILPPEQVKVEVFQYTDKIKMELLPSEKDRQLVLKAQDMSDPEASRIADTIPKQIREELLNGQPIPLDTSPYADFLCSSFCFELAHKKPPFEARGVPILERCLRTLIYQDKLRQAQTSIASRAMTPKRIVWMDKASEIDVEDLRGQIDQALIDPDFSIISNTEIHWDEIGSRDRLLDLSTEYEITNKLLFIGLRITESMLTGESTYSGERIHLDVMNTMYLLYREIISSYVEDYLFAPVAEKKGFWEEDEQGNRTLLYPRLQFTRLALRDNAELQDFMFNLYQKGSLPISYLYELMNVDSEDAHDELKRDLWTQKDATFNEFIRAVLTGAGEKMIDESNILEVLAQNSGLKRNNKSGNRFGKD